MDERLDMGDIVLLNTPTPEQKHHALLLYAGREKKKWIAYVLWVFFMVYYFYLGRPVMNIILWILMCMAVGWIWWFVDLFRISSMVDRKNKDILKHCVREAQLLYPAG